MFAPPSDEPLHRRIGQALVGDLRARLMRFEPRAARDALGLVRARVHLARGLRRYRRGQTSLAELYAVFNRQVIRGRPLALIDRAMEAYAGATVDALDARLVAVLRALRMRGAMTGILSVSVGQVIQRTLELAGAADVFPTEHIVANRLVASGARAEHFTLEIYGAKARWVESAFLRERGLDARRTFYIGDSDDDAPVASILPRGHFIVSFMAGEPLRSRLVRDAGAFAPRDGADLLDHIARLAPTA